MKLADGSGREVAGGVACEAGRSDSEGRARDGADRGRIPDSARIRERFLRQGKQIEVPVLTGSNRDESFGGNPKSAAEFVEQARKRFGDLADAFLKLYPADSDEQARESAFYSGRDEMAFVMRNWARLAAKPGKSKAFVYYFTEQPPRLAERARAVRARAARQRHACL